MEFLNAIGGYAIGLLGAGLLHRLRKGYRHRR